MSLAVVQFMVEHISMFQTLFVHLPHVLSMPGEQGGGEKGGREEEKRGGGVDSVYVIIMLDLSSLKPRLSFPDTSYTKYSNSPSQQSDVTSSSATF